MQNSSNIVVTGGLGFIGKHFVHSALQAGCNVKNVDKVSYAADLAIRREFDNHKNYRFVKADICHLNILPDCDVFVNFAAESHVDSAITNAKNHCWSNFLGVHNCLELIRQKQPSDQPLFVQISTDEVYGDISAGSHSEIDILIPSNPYASTKAAADMLLMSWGRTYGINWNVVRPTNNYGQHQYPEKLIPKSTWRLQSGLGAVLHGDGRYRRSWLHANDTVDAIWTIIENGQRNTVYNVCGGIELENIDVVRRIAKILGVPEQRAWTHIEDRLGQDTRYALDDKRLRALGWAPKRIFDEELEGIVKSFDASRFALEVYQSADECGRCAVEGIDTLANLGVQFGALAEGDGRPNKYHDKKRN
jgi:dTDP-glucose 4,6-dehydratase